MEDYKQPGKKWYPGYVYVIDYGDGKTFKIGSTIGEPENRLKQIVGSTVIMPMHLVMTCYTETNCTWLENLVHMHYDNFHVNGEWFKLDYVELVELYQTFSMFGCADVYDRWFTLIPEEPQQYVEHGVLYAHYPPLAQRDLEIPDFFKT